jgi:hypothetical protein
MAREVYECVFTGNIAGQFVQTVQHLAVDDPTPGTSTFDTALQISQELDLQGVIEAMMNCLPSSYNLTSLRTRRVSAGGGPTAIRLAGDFTAPVVGQRDPEISSLQANPLTIWIPETDPAKTGRLFWPGVAEDDIADMVIVGALVTLYETFNDAWIDGVNLSGIGTFKGCVFRRETKTGDMIINQYISPLIGTQRRRLRPV